VLSISRDWSRSGIKPSVTLRIKYGIIPKKSGIYPNRGLRNQKWDKNTYHFSGTQVATVGTASRQNSSCPLVVLGASSLPHIVKPYRKNINDAMAIKKVSLVGDVGVCVM
jgi:hypothetical protein